MVSRTGFEPNVTTATRSTSGLASTKARAAVVASASERPAIDCDRSTASTTLFDRPRFSASKPATCLPSSRSEGCAESEPGVTTERRMVG